jgi:hypothetical protein
MRVYVCCEMLWLSFHGMGGGVFVVISSPYVHLCVYMIGYK